jgi:hypothetical protein
MFGRLGLLQTTSVSEHLAMFQLPQRVFASMRDRAKVQLFVLIQIAVLDQIVVDMEEVATNKPAIYVSILVDKLFNRQLPTSPIIKCSSICSF